MPRLTKRIPAYRLHKASNQAIVSLDGRDYYLGPWESPESKAEYDRLTQRWLENGRRLDPKPDAAPPPATDELSMVEMMNAYLKHVDQYYTKNGKPTSEPGTVRQAIRFVRRRYRALPAVKFSPKKLKRVRQDMIEHDVTRSRKVRDPETDEVRIETRVLAHGLARKFINKQVNRIRLMFAWAVEEEMIPVAVHRQLMRVKALRKGKDGAREKARIRTVPAASVEAVLPLVPETIRAMIEAQLLCGCRPHEICEIRVTDIDVSDPAVWAYRPQRSKSEHHNDDDDPDRDRIIFLGPRCQAVLKPFMATAKMGYLFSPRRSEAARNEQRREQRQSPMTPSQKARKPRKRTRAPIRDHYDVASYRRAIRRACIKAGIPSWHPHMLRHTTATAIRAKYDVETASTILGHSDLHTIAIYAEKNAALAKQVMSQVG